ncbi:MAG: Carbamoyl-phosphate synthase small chain [Actinobacteria bacterium]|nr:Carbamoyl-phosphate synthase small chain [Actinomycetota bacterium]
MKALLALEDGTYFEGESFGSTGECCGEVVFNTSMTGYQEILTDPSYCSQIVTLTYPEIGNYGVNREDVESRSPFVSGLVVRKCSPSYSNWRAEASLEDFLHQHQILAIQGVDTRRLTRHIRSLGAMRGVLSTRELDPQKLTEKARRSPGLIGRDLVQKVSGDKPYVFQPGPGQNKLWFREALPGTGGGGGTTPRVVVLDFGVKYNILRSLTSLGCEVIVLPARATAKEVLSFQPQGVLLSNGPGDPQAVTYAIETANKLIGKLPIMGICLGHQILALALGANTFKLKFGHRGANHPVLNTRTGRVEITSQNHGFAVEEKSLDKHQVDVTHINLNDGTVEGIEHKELPLFSVQYHPEASPGPHDSQYLFQKFRAMVKP